MITCLALILTAAAEPSDPLEVTVVGHEDREVADIPGSAWVVSNDDLRRLDPRSTNEALSLVPGLTVVEEDGVGLRQNIGIRGLIPDRSGKVLILEDGVPVTLAPYGEPALYVTPVIDRIARIEVVKGAGATRHGPHTVGGVINYVTAPSPEDLTWAMEARGGTWGHLQAQGSVGDTVGDVGFRVDASHLSLRGDRQQNVSRTDVTGRLDLQLAAQQTLMVKLQAYQEGSRATYLGLTTPQFNTTPSLVVAEHDRFVAQRLAGVVRHVAGWGAGRWVTTLYAHQVQRDWRRQDFDRTDEGKPYLDVVGGRGTSIGACVEAGDCPTDGSAIFLEDRTRTRSRAFRVLGLESRATWDTPHPAVHRVELGVRGHVEDIEEQVLASRSLASAANEITRAENRGTLAAAAWARTTVGSRRLKFTPGVRFEAIRLTNHQHAVADDQAEAQTQEMLWVPLPGIGATWEPTQGFVMFAGVPSWILSPSHQGHPRR